MNRLTALVKRLGDKLDDIHVTLDSHHPLHIAHPNYFRNLKTGAMPNPFTLMEEKGGTIVGSDGCEYTTFNVNLLPRTINYLKALVTSNRYKHCIWPMHCLIGSDGYRVVPQLFGALVDWEVKNNAAVDYVSKGSNYFAEHFGAVMAEVPDPEDPSTQLNNGFIETLMEADIILLAGEARSHCLANTVRDIANPAIFAQGDDFIKKCVLLEDCTSDVPGFDALGVAFVNDMKARGMQVSTSVGFLA
jgi:nicotinamidase-related amidase